MTNYLKQNVAHHSTQIIIRDRQLLQIGFDQFPTNTALLYIAFSVLQRGMKCRFEHGP